MVKIVSAIQIGQNKLIVFKYTERNLCYHFIQFVMMLQ